MLNQILKFTLVSSILLWLKPRWRGLLVLALVVLLVHILHGEYLAYVELSGNDTLLVWSFVAKWLLLAVALGVYFALAVVSVSRNSKPGRKNAGGKKSGAKHSHGAAPGEAPTPAVDDGFDFLRHKRELHGEADKVLANLPPKQP